VRVPNFRAEATRIQGVDTALLARSDNDAGAWRLALQHAFADGLANYYAGLYRSAFLCNYVLAVLAVLFAAIHAPLAEFVVICVILIITAAGTHRHWHRRWLDYRDLAEKLRISELLRRGAMAPSITSGVSAAGAWTEWLAAATIREAGLPSLRVDESCTAALRDYLIRRTEAQAAYHAANAHRLERLNHRLHWTGNTAFVVCAVLALAHSLHWHFGIWLNITLPALGAAVFSIRTLGEFERIAARSEQMAKALHGVAEELRQTSNRDHATLARQAQEIAGIMMAETSEWQTVMLQRPLGLPA
jgi:hypothetical protein